MSNSPLATYRKISPNRSAPRNHKIDTVTVHCIVGQWTAKQGCDFFANPARQCSANYVVGRDGSIGISVDECDRSWCSSSRTNDNRAITIEVASDTTHPYAVTDAAYNALIELLADICKRNGIPELRWKADKNLIGHPDQQNMTVHRWFANKACPGEYLYSRHSAIAAAVNKKLGASAPSANNGWFKDQRGWYYLENGSMVKNKWVKDSKEWCYLDGTGHAAADRWIQDGAFWYYLDKDCRMVRNRWVKDSKDWCYVDGEGKMLTNAWVKDAQGWCFVINDGHLLRDGYASDQGGRKYLDKTGHMQKA